MKIYLACPYSHPDMFMKKARFRAANIIAARLMEEGHIVFSPISHSHPIAVQCGLPGDYNFWAKFDESFIEWCDEVHVLKLAGWKKSKGIMFEIEFAKALDKPVEFIQWVKN